MVKRSKLDFYGADSADKILDVYEGSFTATKTSTTYSGHRSHDSIPHDFEHAPLLDMAWSQDGGDSWNGVNTAIPDLSNPAQPVFDTCYVGCYSTISHVVAVASNYTATSRTIKYRIIALSES